MTAANAIAGDRSRLDVSTRDIAERRESTTTVARIATVGLSALVLAAPFEGLRPVLELPGQSLSSLELTLLLVVGAWIAAAVALRRAPRWRTSLTWPWLALLAVSSIAAVSSPSVVNAVHMTGRFALAFVVYLVAVSAGASRAQTRVVLAATTVSAVIASILIALEYLGSSPVLDLLSLFRSSLAVVGAQVRPSGPFQYPTIASMWLEVSFAFALGLLLTAIDARRTAVAAMVLVAVALIGEGVVLTLTRAGLITMASSLLTVGLLRVWRRGRDASLLVLVAIAAVIVVEMVASRSLETMRLRLTTEGQDAWFRADVLAPATLALQTGARTTIPVRVRNAGRLAWEPGAGNPVRFAYHWLEASGERVVIWEGLRTALPRRIEPGATVDLDARVVAPGVAGRYQLAWDLEQVRRLWFSSEPDVSIMTTDVTVSGPQVSSLESPRTLYLPRAPARPGRLALWRAALRMVREHPIVGVGPDNFRLLYGRYAGLAKADPRVHSNNMFVELFVGTGFAGLGIVAWLSWRIGGACVAAGVRGSSTLAGIVAACLAIAVHGLVDSFLSFTATYILFALTIGLLVSAASSAGERHAHRV